MFQLPANEAFDAMIEDGLLTTNENDENFAGNYMFMGIDRTNENKLLFKHIITRQYLKF